MIPLRHIDKEEAAGFQYTNVFFQESDRLSLAKVFQETLMEDDVEC